MRMRIIFLSILAICLLNYINSTICRDGSYCPGLSTCCLTPTGVGCCPYQNAVCCGDGYHCCPYGFICGPGTCYREKNLFEKPIEAMKIDHSCNEKDSKKPESPLIKIDINYIIEKCLQDRFVETPFKNMIINCQEKEIDYEAAQNCKFALLHILNEGLIRNPDCYERVNALIKRL
jgi:hypothetical protein